MSANLRAPIGMIFSPLLANSVSTECVWHRVARSSACYIMSKSDTSACAHTNVTVVHVLYTLLIMSKSDISACAHVHTNVTVVYMQQQHTKAWAVKSILSRQLKYRPRGYSRRDRSAGKYYRVASCMAADPRHLYTEMKRTRFYM